MTKTEFTELATKVVGAIALLLVALGVLRPDPPPPFLPECAAIVAPLPADTTWRLP